MPSGRVWAASQVGESRFRLQDSLPRCVCVLVPPCLRCSNSSTLGILGCGSHSPRLGAPGSAMGSSTTFLYGLLLCGVLGKGQGPGKVGATEGCGWGFVEEPEG